MLSMVGVCACHQADPNESQLKHVKRMIWYVSRISIYGINFTTDTTCKISDYIDVDWARNQDDKKITSDDYFYIGNNLVSWHGKKKNSILLSTTKLHLTLYNSIPSHS